MSNHAFNLRVFFSLGTMDRERKNANWRKIFTKTNRLEGWIWNSETDRRTSQHNITHRGHTQTASSFLNLLAPHVLYCSVWLLPIIKKIRRKCTQRNWIQDRFCFIRYEYSVNFARDISGFKVFSCNFLLLYLSLKYKFIIFIAFRAFYPFKTWFAYISLIISHAQY